MQKRALSQPQVAAIQAPGNHWVGPAPLYLQIRPQGTRSWLFRYQRQGKTRWMGLGPAAGIAPVTLPDARDKALRLYVAVRDGADPVAGAGFEPAYAERPDLQSGGFNHSPTPPQVRRAEVGSPIPGRTAAVYGERLGPCQHLTAPRVLAAPSGRG